MSCRADEMIQWGAGEAACRAGEPPRRAAGPETWQHCTLLYPPTSGSPPTSLTASRHLAHINNDCGPRLPSSSHLISSPTTFLCRKNYEATHLRFSTIFRQCPKIEIVTILLMALLSGFVFVFTRDWVPAVRTVMHGNGLQHIHSILWQRYRYLFCWRKNIIKYVAYVVYKLI